MRVIINLVSTVKKVCQELFIQYTSVFCYDIITFKIVEVYDV